MNKIVNRSVRSLVNLASGGSTARTLNLMNAWARFGGEPDYQTAPMFNNVVLNRAILVKHRLRRDEVDLFEGDVRTATKVLLPIDTTDLRMGAHYFMVGQRGYRDVLETLAIDDKDAGLLTLLDGLPSLDPFLMRERLKRSGYHPSRFYFDLSDADVKKMMSFASDELRPLARMTGENREINKETDTARLAAKILSNEGDANLEPLRLAMSMGKAEFDEGAFCWKGFIYYKWSLVSVLAGVRPVLSEIAALNGDGPLSNDEKIYLAEARVNIEKGLVRVCNTVKKTIGVYEDAFAQLTQKGHPQAFREFLLKAPTLFHDLGEWLGAVQHILTFWRFRFPVGEKHQITAEELIDLFKDFEASLNFDHGGSHARVA